MGIRTRIERGNTPSNANCTCQKGVGGKVNGPTNRVPVAQVGKWCRGSQGGRRRGSVCGEGAPHLQAQRCRARPVLETELAINRTFILATYLVKKKRTEKTTRNLKHIHNTKIGNPNK